MLKKLLCVFGFLSFFSTIFTSELQTLATHRKLRFFSLDIHSSVTADVENILRNLGHDFEFWTISHLSYKVFGKPIDSLEIIDNCHIANFELTVEKCYQFYEKYRAFLSQFDCFVVSHYSPFCFIFEKLNKPIIVIISQRYEAPFTSKPEQWKSLNEYLTKATRSNQLHIIANNKADQMYLKHFTGLNSEHIPSLCHYTQAQYSGKKDRFVMQSNVSMNGYLNRLTAKLMPEVIATTPGFYSWHDYYSYKGVVHFPYQVSTMSLFEQYSANVPLFFPSKKLLRKLHKKNPGLALGEISFHSFLGMREDLPPGDLNNINDPNVFNLWIDNADFYDEENMPYIQYFDSLKQLYHLLTTVNLQEISAKMKEHNVKRKEMVYKKWEKVLEKVAAACESN